LSETKYIIVKSMVGARTGQGAVMLRLGDEYINLPLASARDIAQQLVECAAAAQQDADILALMRSMGESDDQAQALLIAMRDIREQRQ